MTPDNEKRRRLYDNLKARGGLPVDYETFSVDMADPNKRSALYDKLSKMGGGLPDFETFSMDIAGDLQTPAQQPPAAPMPGKPQAPTAPTPLPSVSAVGSSASMPVASGQEIDLLGVKPLGSEVRETIPQQRIQVAQEVAADTGPEGLVQRNIRGTKQRASEDTVALNDLKGRASAPLFSAPPPAQQQDMGLAPQVDPRWEKVMQDYRASGAPQFTEKEIADRKAAGTWTLRDDERQRINAAHHQIEMIDDREQKLADAAVILNERGVPAMRQQIHEMELELTGLTQKQKTGQWTQADVDKYNSIYSKYEAVRSKYNEAVEPIIKEQAEIEAARNYLSSIVGDAIRGMAKDPLELERIGKQIMSTRGYEKDFGAKQDIIDPILNEVRRMGGNAIATGARMMNAFGNLPNRAIGNEDYYSPFAEIADITAQGLERLDAEIPEQAKGSLLDDDWSLNEGALPKFVKAATFMGALGVSGGSAGAPGMTAASILGTSEDYYQGALKEGLTPKQAEAIALLLSSTEAGIEIANPGPFLNGGVRKEMAKRAVKLLKEGRTKPSVAREVFGYAAQQAFGEGGEEVATEFAQDMVTRGFNMVEGSKLETGLELKGLAESFIMGAALGGLMGGGSRVAQRPLMKESVAWAVEHPSEFTEYVNTKVPEQQRKEVMEKFQQQQRIYRGLPPTITAENRQNIAAAITEKERIKKEQSDAVVDETVAAAVGDSFTERIKEQDEIIAKELGISLEEVAKAQEADRLREQYDKAKLKSEVTGDPMPEGMTRPKDFEPKTEPTKTAQSAETPTAVGEETVTETPFSQTFGVKSLTKERPKQGDVKFISETTPIPEPVMVSKGLRGVFGPDGERVNAHFGVNGVFATTDTKEAQRYAGDMPVSDLELPAGTTMQTIEVGGDMEDLREREIAAINDSEADVVKLVTMDAGKSGKQEQYVIKRPDLVESIMAPLKGRSLSSQSLQEAFGYTPEVADATVAIADAMGLDKSKIKVVKGGEPGEGAMWQGEDALPFGQRRLTQSELAEREELMPMDQVRNFVLSFVAEDGYSEGGQLTVDNVVDAIKEARKKFAVTNVKAVLNEAVSIAEEIWEDVQGEALSSSDANAFQDAVAGLKEMASMADDADVRALVRTLSPRTQRGERVIDQDDTSTLFQSPQQDQAFNGIETPKTPIGDTKTVTVDGKERTVFNSNGKPIHPTVEGVRNFWRWFSDSRVVDAEGRPLVVYHGTSEDFDTFKPGTIHVSDSRDTADSYARGYLRTGEGVVLELYAKIELPIDIRTDEKVRRAFDLTEVLLDEEIIHDPERLSESIPDLEASGFDGIIVEHEHSMGVKGGGNEYIAFSPTQIKSATGNYGTFDPKNPSILQQDAKGAVEFAEGGQAIIRALQSPDASTGIHELAHVARRFLFDKNIPQEQRKGITDEHIKTAEEWSGAKDGNWTREAEEKFARGFERYLRDGKAPNDSLKDVFEKFAAWLRDIYLNLFTSPVKDMVSPEMRKVFDALVTRGENIKQAQQKKEDGPRGERVDDKKGEAPKGQRADEAAAKETPTPTPQTGGVEEPVSNERQKFIRATAKKIKDVHPELFKMLVDDTVNYERFPNAVSKEVADELIATLGNDAAKNALVDMGNGLPGAVRSQMYKALSAKLLSEKEYGKLIELQDGYLEKVTDAAQLLQAMYDTYGVFFPKEYYMRRARKTVDSSRSESRKRSEKKTKKVLKDLREVNKRGADAVETDIDFQKKVLATSTANKGEAPPKTKPAPKKGGTSTAPKRRQGPIKRETYERWVQEMGTTMYSAIIPPQLIGIAAYHIQEGAITFAEVAEKVVRKLGRKALPYLKGAYKEAAKEFEWTDGLEPSTDAEIDEYIAKANTDKIVEAFKRATEKGDKKAQAKAISDLQDVSKRMGTWGLYEKEAVSRLKQLTQQQIAKDILDHPVLDEFTAGLVRNLGAQIKEEAEKHGLPDKKRPEGPENAPIKSDIQIIGDAFKNIEKYKSVWEKTQNSFKNKLRAAEARLEKAETPEARKEAEDAIAKENARLQALDDYFGEVLSKPFSEKGLDSAVKKGLKDLNIRINDIIKQHYTVQEGRRMELQDGLVTEAGLSGPEAEYLAKEAGKVFDKYTAKARQAIIDRIISPKERKNPKRKEAIDDIISLVNSGAFSNEEFIEKYGDAKGWAKITPAIIQDIEKIADRIQRAPEGRPRMEATEDMYTYLANLEGISKWEIGQALWYASVLSGSQTHEVNFGANLFQLASEITKAQGRALSKGDIIAFFENFKAVAYGAMRALPEVASVWRTGYSPIRGKIEVPPALERTSFRSVKWGAFELNPFNYAKYPRRAMVAADTLFFEPLKELRAQQLAMKMARSSVPSDQVRQRALEILNRDNQSVELAEQQADEELDNELRQIREMDGMSEKAREAMRRKAFRDRGRRVFELVERGRPDMIKADSARFAARATYNYTPEGALGVAAGAINFFLHGAPIFRPLIPFVNIIANVANETINYTPIGYARAVSGGSVLRATQDKLGIGKPSKETMTDSQLEEYRADQTAASIIGLVTFASLLAMSQFGDDDEEPLIEITANGTGSWRDNKALVEGAGWQQYSYKIRGTDTWISYRETPLFAMFALVGHYNDFVKYRKEKIDDTFMTRWSAAAGQTAWSLRDMTMLGTINDLLEVANDPKGEDFLERVKKVTGNVVRGGLVPAIYTQTARSVESAFDIPAKDVRDEFLGYMYQDIPVLRSNLNDRINFLGDPIIPEGGVLPRFLNDAKTDDIAKLINRGWTPSVPQPGTLKAYDPAIGKERVFTKDEQYAFYKLRGALLKRWLTDNMEALMEVPKFELDKTISSFDGDITEAAKSFIVFRDQNNKWMFGKEPFSKEQMDRIDADLKEYKKETERREKERRGENK